MVRGPPRNWEGGRRLPETTPSWWQGARHPRFRELYLTSGPRIPLPTRARAPPHPSPQDLASPRPSLRPFLHFHSLPAPSPEFPPFLPPPFLPPRPWPSSAATAPLTRLLWTACPGGLGVSPPSPAPSRAPDDSLVPTSGLTPAAPNFSQLNFPPRRGQASPLRARPPAHRARPRGGPGGGERGPRPGRGGALPGTARHQTPALSREAAARASPRGTWAPRGRRLWAALGTSGRKEETHTGKRRHEDVQETSEELEIFTNASGSRFSPNHPPLLPCNPQCLQERPFLCCGGGGRGMAIGVTAPGGWIPIALS